MERWGLPSLWLGHEASRVWRKPCRSHSLPGLAASPPAGPLWVDSRCQPHPHHPPPHAQPSGLMAFRHSQASPRPCSGYICPPPGVSAASSSIWEDPSRLWLLRGFHFEDFANPHQGSYFVPRLGSAWPHTCQLDELGWVPASGVPSFSHAKCR